MPDRHVLCNGKSLAITANMEKLLLQLCLYSGERLLWIDSMCINQASVEEKNPQVSSMPEIFMGAQQLLIWLGEGDDETDAFIKHVNEVGRKFDGEYRYEYSGE